jgi:hypothetical protein
VSTTAVMFLGIIAVATLVTAVGQVVFAIVMARLAKRIEGVVDSIDRDIRPLIANANAVAANAARVSEVAVDQMERADRVFTDLAHRIENTSRLVQGTILAPAREGRALLAAIGAAIGVVRDGRLARASQAAADEDDPLFIG